jgi:UTP--glucose-1-phosphate uridylyltransferase
VTSKVTKAVIPAAGLGTRFLPASKAVPKEMIPLVDKPVIQWVVEEAVAAGITDILIITGRTKRPVEDHFDISQELEVLLQSKGKTKEIEELRKISDMANVHYIRQGESLGLGHAVLKAKQHVGREPFAVLLGDDVMHPDSTVLKDMIASHERLGSSVVALQKVPREEISSYGCADVEEVDGNLVKINGVVEKPPVDEAPSDLAVIGRYVLTPEVFDELENTGFGAGGEIQLTDALDVVRSKQGLYGWSFDKGRFDTGNKLEYLKANVELALERPEFGPELRKYLHELLAREDQA